MGQKPQQLGAGRTAAQSLSAGGQLRLQPSNSAQSRGGKSASNQRWFFIHQLIAPQNGANAQQYGASASRVLSEPISSQEKQRRLEAAIFLSPEGETSRKLAKLAGLADATEARTLIRQINQSLDAQGRAYRIEEVAGGYALMTRSQFAPWLRRLNYVPGAVKLSQSALETLAVVAYRQPVLRANVEAIRGVNCSEVLKQLMELDLVRISGRSEDLGRPYLYGTTRRFLQMFGLRSADRLPRSEWVNQAHLPLSPQEPAEIDSESKESTVKKNFTATALLERNAHNVDESLLEPQTLVPSAIDDDDFDDDDDDFDDDDDEEEWDDDDEDDLDEAEEDADDLDEDEAEEDADEDEEEADWEEVDDDDDLDDDADDADDDEEDDDWDDDEDEDDEEEDWD